MAGEGAGEDGLVALDRASRNRCVLGGSSGRRCARRLTTCSARTWRRPTVGLRRARHHRAPRPTRPPHRLRRSAHPALAPPPARRGARAAPRAAPRTAARRTRHTRPARTPASSCSPRLTHSPHPSPSSSVGPCCQPWRQGGWRRGPVLMQVYAEALGAPSPES